MSQFKPEPANVLLVEDDPHDASLFLERVRHFAPGEFSVTQARSLAIAIDEASDSEYKLAVIDLTLPDSSGIETCSKFHSANPNVPFIVLTGIADGSLRETIQRVGAKAALVKDDCSSSDLLAAMRTACLAEAGANTYSEASKAAAKARLRNGIIDTADGILVVDATGKIALVNSGAEKVLGHTTGELLGTELGMDLKPGHPVRAQVMFEKNGLAEVHDDNSNLRQFDVCKLSITELEFWPFEHTWAGKPVTICAIRDVSRQMTEESHQRDVVKLEQPLHVAAGIDEIGTDLAVRLGSLVRFNRFEASIWRPDLNRLQVIFQLGAEARGRKTSDFVSRSSVPGEFGSWLSERSSEQSDPCVYVSIGHIEPDQYGRRDENVIARCAAALASSMAMRRIAPVMSDVMPVPPMASAGSAALPEVA